MEFYTHLYPSRKNVVLRLARLIGKNVFCFLRTDRASGISLSEWYKDIKKHADKHCYLACFFMLEVYDGTLKSAWIF